MSFIGSGCAVSPAPLADVAGASSAVEDFVSFFVSLWAVASMIFAVLERQLMREDRGAVDVSQLNWMTPLMLVLNGAGEHFRRRGFRSPLQPDGAGLSLMLSGDRCPGR